MKAAPKKKKEQVNGIGGVFFRARNTTRMANWYRKHLGIQSKDGHADFVWREKNRPKQMGRTIWTLFPNDTDYLSSSQFMINYRVANLDRMLKQLRRGGVKIEKIEDYDYGRFAWITDPEGNRIELWEQK
jgi:predicted enzyme related to lactoylglutathione lyase